MWAVGAGVLLYLFRYEGRTILFKWDGIYQHYLAFYRMCDYGKAIFFEGAFPGFFDFFIGQGNDVFTTLGCYDLTDPVSVIAGALIFLPRLDRFTVMVFIKFYLIGIAFWAYCRAVGIRDKRAIMAGALTYVFSGAVLFMFPRHPNYINWAYFLPLLLASIELYRRRGRRLPLIIVVFLNIITSYYTFYMNAVLAVLYVFFLSVSGLGKSEKKVPYILGEISRWFRIAGLFLTGGLLAAVSLLPTICAYLVNARVANATGYTLSALHYEPFFYLKILAEFFTPLEYPPYTSYIGLNAVALIPLILFFLTRGKHRHLKWQIVSTAAMLGIPMAGRILNGMGYATNRFSYALVFYLAAALTVWAEEAGEKAHGRGRLALGTALAAGYVLWQAYLYVYPLDPVGDISFDVGRKLVIVMLAVGAAAVLFAEFSKKRFRLLAFDTAAFICGVIGVWATFDPGIANYMKAFAGRENAEEYFTDQSIGLMKDTDLTDFYRVEKAELSQNPEIFNHVRGTSVWYSLLPQTITDYYEGLGISPVLQNCRFGGLGSRPDLMELAAVRYYTAEDRDTLFLPDGYVRTQKAGSGFRVYKNETSLPLGYTYKEVLSEAAFDELNEADRGLALMQGILLNDRENTEESLRPTASAKELPFRRGTFGNVIFTKYSKGGYSCTSVGDGGFVNFELADVPEDHELILYLKNIRLKPGSTDYLTVTSSHYGGGKSVVMSTRLTTEMSNWHVTRGNIVLDLGQTVAGPNTVVLRIWDAASITMDDIKILAIPSSAYDEGYERLSECVLEDIEVTADRITGRIDVPDHRWLQFAVPYSRGWTARIDGKVVPLYRSDYLYMAVELEAGEHDVELTYLTPGLKEGFLISLVTAAVLLLLGGAGLLKRRRAKKAMALADEAVVMVEISPKTDYDNGGQTAAEAAGDIKGPEASATDKEQSEEDV